MGIKFHFDFDSYWSLYYHFIINIEAKINLYKENYCFMSYFMSFNQFYLNFHFVLFMYSLYYNLNCLNMISYLIHVNSQTYSIFIPNLINQ